jgi:hypothetical protein
VQNAPPSERSLVIYLKANGDRVQGVSFFDGWMRPMPARETSTTKTTGEGCQLYYFDAPTFNDEMQFVLEVHPQIEELQVPVDLKNVDLP